MNIRCSKNEHPNITDKRIYKRTDFFYLFFFFFDKGLPEKFNSFYTPNKNIGLQENYLRFYSV